MTKAPPFASTDGLRNLDIVSQRYGQRPSAMLGIADPYRAWCWDEACAIVGLHAETEAMKQGAHGEQAGLRNVGGQVVPSGFIPKVPEPDW